MSGIRRLGVIALVGCLAVGALAGVPTTEPARESPQVLNAAEHHVGDLIPDLSFRDLDGRSGKLGDVCSHKAMVICLTSVGCPITKKYGPTIVDLEKRYRDRGVSFLLVNPEAHETAEREQAALANLKRLGFGGRYVADREGVIARALGATSSAEVFVLDAARTLVYRGAIDDQYGLGYSLPAAKRAYLADALDAVLANVPPAVAATSAPGCALDVSSMKPAAMPVTYHNRISRLIQRNCEGCHRPGEAAPFALTNYGEVKDRLAMIRKVVRSGVMPPWFADPVVGHWANDRTLAERDKADLLAWITAGAPEGNPADAPLPLTYARGWQIGKPDAVFEAVTPINVPAKGPIKYQYVVAPTGLTEDKWIQAIEIRVTQPQVVHHVLAFLLYPPGDPRGEQQMDLKGGLKGYFAGLVPNQGAMTYPLGTAKLLPRGASLLLQIHYTPDGTAVQDRPRVGVMYAKQKPEHEVLTLAASNPRFRIPPGESNYEVQGTYRFTGAARLLSFNPHAHLRAVAWKYELLYPDGRTETVLNVPRYDFNWQVEYHLRDAIDVPAGTVLRATAWYDNSDKNPANPDATKWVKFGEQTSDEMMIGYFTGHALP